MQTLRRLYARLRLRVNEAKSAVARPQDRKFLGYSFWVAKGREIRRRVAPKALAAMKERVREITTRNGGRSMDRVIAELRSYLKGWKGRWKAYFRLAETPRVFRDLDEWIRRELADRVRPARPSSCLRGAHHRRRAPARRGRRSGRRTLSGFLGGKAGRSWRP